MNIAKALESLCPTAEWAIRGDELEWLSTTIQQPTDTELQTEIARLKVEYDAQEYARNRSMAYANIKDQLDMQYWDSVNGTTTWSDHVVEIKALYPKPE